MKPEQPDPVTIAKMMTSGQAAPTPQAPQNPPIDLKSILIQLLSKPPVIQTGTITNGVRG